MLRKAFTLFVDSTTLTLDNSPDNPAEAEKKATHHVECECTDTIAHGWIA